MTIKISTLFVLVILLFIPTQSTAQDLQTEVLRLKEKLIDDAGLSRRDADVIEPELREFLTSNTSTDAVTAITRESIGNNCLDYCLMGMLDVMNQAIARGLSPTDAQTIVADEMRGELRESDVRVLNDPTLPLRVRERVEARTEARLELKGPEGMAPEMRAPGEERGER